LSNGGGSSKQSPDELETAFDNIGRFDQLLLDLRKYCFSFVASLTTADSSGRKNLLSQRMKLFLTLLASLSLITILTSFSYADEPSTLNDTWAQGLDLESHGNYTGALSKFDEILKNYPNDTSVLTSVLDEEARIFGKQGNYDAEINASEQALKIDPNDTTALDNEAFAFGNKENYSAVIQTSKSVLKINPNDTSALVNIGVSFHRLGNYSASLDAYDKALKIDPNETFALSDKAVLLLDLGENNDARVEADKALKVDSNVIRAWYVKAIAFSNLGKPEESSAAFNQMISINSTDFKELNFVASQLDNYQRYDEEIQILDQILNIKPNDTTALGDEGEAEVKLGQYFNANQTYSQLLSLQPSDTDTLNREGDVLLKLNQYDIAKQVFDRALRIDNENEQALSGKGFALFNLGQYKDAIEQYDKAYNFTYDNTELLTLAERKADALGKLNETEKLAQNGEQSYNNGNYDQALIYYDHFLQFEPKNVTILEKKALTSDSFAIPRPTLTMLTADEILEIKPDDSLALRLKGDSLYNMHKYDDADKYYTEALDINPNDIFSLVGEGNTLSSKTKYNKAIEIFDQAIKNNKESNDPSIRYEVFNAYLGEADADINLGKYNDADRLFSWLLLNRQNDYNVFDERANYYFQLNKPEVAIIWYDKALQVTDNTDSNALNGKAACLFKLRNYNDSLTYLNLASDETPDDSTILTNMAEALNKLGNFTSAIQSAEKAIEFDPKNADALTQKGNAFFGLGSYRQAKEWYDKSLEIEPDNEGALVGKGKTLLKMGSYADSIQSTDDSLDILSKNSKTNVGGLTQEELDLQSEALKSKIEALVLLGSQELKNQALDDASKSFKEALSIDPKNSDALKGQEEVIKAVNNQKFSQQINEYGIYAGIIAAIAAVVPFIHKKRKQRMKSQKQKNFDKGLISP